MAFKEIIGQNLAISILRKSIKENRLVNTYLFVGPEGVGKKQAAISFAQALNCPVLPGEGCGECLTCREIKNFNFPDLLYYEPDGMWYKIQQVREMRREIYLKPLQSKWKIVILDSAHQLRNESANALLKSLEEPPYYTIFILLAWRPEMLLPTIISRSQIINFTYLNNDELRQVFKNVPEEKLDIIIALAQGSPGKGFYWLEEENWNRREEFFKYLSQLKKEELLPVFDLVDFLAEDKKVDNILPLLELLLFWWRDLLFWKLFQKEEFITQRDFIGEIVRKSQDYSLDKLRRNFRSTQDAIRGIRNNANLLLTLETLFIRTGVLA
ncbi:MAG: DNA polymerase III subunit delta' [Dictyoglomus sp. NZ13-RE01]|nr:MAG: DNA polymerase III subunit delta' [Dictyoglomus sp. NZ13-RE01]